MNNSSSWKLWRLKVKYTSSSSRRSQVISRRAWSWEVVSAKKIQDPRRHWNRRKIGSIELFKDTRKSMNYLCNRCLSQWKVSIHSLVTSKTWIKAMLTWLRFIRDSSFIHLTSTGGNRMLSNAIDHYSISFSAETMNYSINSACLMITSTFTQTRWSLI